MARPIAALATLKTKQNQNPAKATGVSNNILTLKQKYSFIDSALKTNKAAPNANGCHNPDINQIAENNPAPWINQRKRLS